MAVSEQTDATLREVVEALCALDRTSCSKGEAQAAAWIADRLRAAGVPAVAEETEPSWGPFPPTMAALGVVHLAGALLVLRGRRAAGVALSAAASAGLADEVMNGPRFLRRAIRRRRTTVNVVGRLGPADAQRTLLVLAHHDAPQTGAVYDQTWQQAAFNRAPQIIGPLRTPPPQWWAGLAGPLLSALGAVTGRRCLQRAGALVGAAGLGVMLDIWRSPTVAGANDNASGVGGLVAVAERLAADPPPGVRVLLVSCGAEETLQDGIRAFIARHGADLDPDRTVVVNLETIGSPELAMLEAEGPIRMERYAGEPFRDWLCALAAAEGIEIERGFRARASTDGITTSRHGLPTATLISVTPWRTLANYHLRSDVPEHLDYETAAAAVELTVAAARGLASWAPVPAGSGARPEW